MISVVIRFYKCLQKNILFFLQPYQGGVLFHFVVTEGLT
jgi:hypothetical protein